MIRNCLRAPLAVVALTEAKGKDVHDLALDSGAHAYIAEHRFEPSHLHRVVQDDISCAWKSRLHPHDAQSSVAFM